MRTELTLFPAGPRMAAMGAAIWLVLLAGVFFGVFRLSIFDLLFLLAPLVVGPLALSLIPTTQGSVLSQLCNAVARYLIPLGAGSVTASFFLKDGRTAGALVCSWLIIAAALALDGLDRLIRTHLHSFQQFCFAVGEGYSFVGALWLLASRLGLRPVGFHEPIVLLTAVHFHYAGLMASVLAGLAAAKSGNARTLILLRAALACGVLGPGLLGLAFLVGPKLKLAAVGVMVIGECGIALGTFRIGLNAAKSVGGRFLLFGCVCVIFGMALAGVWAVGEYPLHAFVNLEQMARYHGVLNSLGFGLCSLVGWTLLRRKSSEVSEV